MNAENHSGTPWPRPPSGGYTVDDLFNLPDLPPHTELIDGRLVDPVPQQDFHGLTISLLGAGLRRTVPEQLRVRTRMVVVITRQTVPEPDLIVVYAEAVTGMRQTRYEAADVLLAVEVVSPESVGRDRETKPLKYAKAGIRHFWRVEMTGEKDHPTVYTYELDTDAGAYVVTGIHHDRLKLSEPFTIDIDLTEIDRL